jgi:sugar O-acyltransferase (sialic acid O-acetyltransferase NeuD family)
LRFEKPAIDGSDRRVVSQEKHCSDGPTLETDACAVWHATARLIDCLEFCLTVLRDIVFWGATGQARVLREFLSETGYQLVALFDRDTGIPSPFAGIPIYHGVAGMTEWLSARPRAGTACAVAVGRAGIDRLKIQRELQAMGLVPVSLVHPRAYVARGARLGIGCQVLAASVVGADSLLGDACIVNTAASVDHECILGDGVHIAPGATVAGCVNVGEGAFIGAGAVILPRLEIGRLAVVGAGAVVTRNVGEGEVVLGNPARLRTSASE